MVKKERYKMYKSGKNWIFAGIIGVALGAAAADVAENIHLDFFPAAIHANAAVNEKTTNGLTVSEWKETNNTWYKRYENSSKNLIGYDTEKKWKNSTAIIDDTLAKNVTFDFKSIEPTSDGNYNVTLVFNTKTIDTDGRKRFSYFDVLLSDSLNKKQKSVSASMSDGTTNVNTALSSMNDKNGVPYLHAYINTGKVVGGEATLTIKLEAVKMLSTDSISAMYSSDTDLGTGQRPIWSTAKYISGSAFADRYNAALLDHLKKKSTTSLNNADSLSESQKNDFSNQINNVTTSDDFVNDLAKIDQNVVQANNDAKSAKAAADAARSAALVKINNEESAKKAAVESLSIDDKEQKLKDIENAAQTARDGINNAGTVEEINTDVTNGISAIDLVADKAAAKDAIESEKTNQINAVQDLTGIDSTTLAKLIEDIKTSATTAETNIEAQNSSDDVATQKDNGISAIDLIAEKIKAMDAVAKDSNAKAQAIEAMTLTDEEKASFTNAVKEAAQSAQTQINNAQLVLTVNNAQSDAISTIEAQYDNAVALGGARDKAIAAIKEQLATSQAAVDKMTNLTDQEAAKTSLETAANSAIDAIKNATNVDDAIENAKNTGIANIQLGQTKLQAENDILAYATQQTSETGALGKVDGLTDNQKIRLFQK